MDIYGPKTELADVDPHEAMIRTDDLFITDQPAQRIIPGRPENTAVDNLDVGRRQNVVSPQVAGAG